MERHVYGVTELNELVKAVLDSVPEFGNVCVRGEISSTPPATTISPSRTPAAPSAASFSRDRPSASGSGRRTA